jgi:hypothetical protein
VHAPASVLTTTVTGVVTRAAPTRRLVRTVPAGRMSVSLLAAGAGPLTVSITTASGVRLVRRSGESPLRFTVRTNGGLLRFVVDGARRRHRFVLNLSTAQ